MQRTSNYTVFNLIQEPKVHWQVSDYYTRLVEATSVLSLQVNVKMLQWMFQLREERVRLPHDREWEVMTAGAYKDYKDRWLCKCGVRATVQHVLWECEYLSEKGHEHRKEVVALGLSWSQLMEGDGLSGVRGVEDWLAAISSGVVQVGGSQRWWRLMVCGMLPSNVSVKQGVKFGDFLTIYCNGCSAAKRVVSNWRNTNRKWVRRMNDVWAMHRYLATLMGEWKLWARESRLSRETCSIIAMPCSEGGGQDEHEESKRQKRKRRRDEAMGLAVATGMLGAEALRRANKISGLRNPFSRLESWGVNGGVQDIHEPPDAARRRVEATGCSIP
jgi:hypothetical protein